MEPSPQSETELGQVDSLWRYPVKSMAGESLDAVAITARGLAGDRRYALIDTATGKLVSAKKPQSWGRMLDFLARFEGDPDGEHRVRITIPGAGTIDITDIDANGMLSAALGRPVRLHATAPPGVQIEYAEDPLNAPDTMSEFPPATAAPQGTFFDFGPVHLLSTATLSRLRALYPGGRFERARFRPNIVVQSPDDEAGFVDNDWVGRIVAIGEQVRLRVVEPAPRCVMTTLAQGDLPTDPGILRTIAQHNQTYFSLGGRDRACIGVYATVLRGGSTQPGDRVALAVD